MKKLIYIFTFLLSFSLSAQDLYWYDVFLDVKNQNAKAFENAVDKFYSSVDFPEGVTMTFSNIALKGQGFKETHILSFVSSTSSSLADFRSSLSGEEWEKYLESGLLLRKGNRFFLSDPKGMELSNQILISMFKWWDNIN